MTDEREWEPGDRCRIGRDDDAPTGTVVATAFMGAVVAIRLDGEEGTETYLARRLHPALTEGP